MTDPALGQSTLVVATDGPADHRTIGDAISAAAPGTRILVRPGTYDEVLVIDKPVDLLADGPAGTVIIQSRASSCVEARTEHATVRGFTLRNPNQHGKQPVVNIDLAGVKGPRTLTIEDCDITSAGGSCIAIKGPGAAASIRGCRIHDSAGAGILLSQQGLAAIQGCGIWGNRDGGVQITRSLDAIAIFNQDAFLAAAANVVIENCDITSAGGSCIAIKGLGTAASIRGCRIHDSAQAGVFVSDQGRATIEDCEIWGNTDGGVQITKGGDPTVRACRIRDGQQAGVIVSDLSSKGTIEDCEISGNKLAGVDITKWGNPTVRACRIHEGQEAGVFVHEHGRGTIEDCEIWGNKLAGIAITAGGTPAVRACRIHDGQDVGVVVHEHGKGTIEGCEIWGNRLAGVQIRGRGDPTVRACIIRDGQSAGVFVHDRGRGSFENCEIWGNAAGDVEAADGCKPVLRHCTVGLGRATDAVDQDQPGAGLSAAVGALGQPSVVVARHGPEDYRKITDAIKAAVPGTRILVRPGTYSTTFSELVIDKPVELIADGPAGTVIIQSNTASCILARAHQAVVRGFTIRGLTSSKPQFAVDIAGGSLVIEDCDITSKGLSCVAVHGPATLATIRGCRIHDSNQSGIFVSDRGRGTIEDCEIWGNNLAGVEVKTGGDPTVRACRIRDGRAGGIFVWDQGRGTIEDCEIWGNNAPGVEIKTGGDPTVQACRIRDGRSAGILAWDQGKGTVEDCEIWGNNRGGVEIRTGGDPTVRACRIRDGQHVGVWVYDEGRGTIEDCEIGGNAYSGVEIKTGGDPTVRACRIRDGRQAGMLFHERGKGTIKDCEIWGNTLAAVQITTGGDPAVRGCRIRDGQHAGVFVHERGKGTIEDCEIWGNTLAGVEITTGGDPVVRDCRIRDGQQAGVFVHEHGQGTIEACEIWGNATADLVVADGCEPVLRYNDVGVARAADVADEDGPGAGTSAEGAVGPPVVPEGGPYRHNAFRVSGLPVTATAAQMRQAATRARAGSAAAGADRLLALEPAPDAAQVEEALRRLRDPVLRFYEAFFWFLPLPSGAEDPALAALAAGDPEQAALVWQRRGGDDADGGGDDGVARHNLAVLAHARALDHAAAGRAAPDELWEQAFTSWRAVLGDDVFWSAVTATSQQTGDPRLRNAAAWLRVELPGLLLTTSAALVASLAQAGQPDQAARHAGMLRDSGLGSGHITRACEQAAAPVIARIRDLGQRAEGDAGADPAHGSQVAVSLLERTGPLLAAVDALLQKGNTARDGIHDELARRVRQCQIPYAIRTEDWAGSLPQLRQARAIAATATARQDLDTQITNVESQADAATRLALAAACWSCGKPPNTDKPAPVPIHFVVQKTPRGHLRSWKSVTIKVPACDRCYRAYTSRLTARSSRPRFEDFPDVREQLEQGWHLGEVRSHSDGTILITMPGGRVIRNPRYT